MQQPISLKPQDVAILVKLLVNKNPSWRQVDLAQELGLNQGEIAKALKRLEKAGLFHNRNANRSTALEFIIHAIKYIFPVEVGALTVGVPTGLSCPAHEKMVLHSNDDVYVWPSAQGKKRGQLIKPFYSKLAEAALKDADFYGLMAAIEILRVGRARERKLAEKYLERKIKDS